MTKRLASIDALRGLALLLMIIDHCFDWWLAGEYRGGSADRLTEFLGSLAAPIFIALVGVGLALSVSRSCQRGRSFEEVVIPFVQRGLFFIFLGYVLNFVIFFTGNNWADVFAVDVLHLIGLGIMTGVFVAWWLPWWAALLLAALWAVLSAQFGGTFTLPPVLGAWVNAETGTGYFPMLPWLAYVWFGIGAGKICLRPNKAGDGSPLLNSGWLLLAGLGFGALMMVVPNIGFRHPHLGFICLSLAVMFLLWAVLQRLDTLTILTSRVLVAPLALLGQVAFMLYFFHHLIGYRLLYHLGIVTGRSWFGHYGALDPTQALVGTLIVIILCYLVAGPWLRVRASVQAVVYRPFANLLPHLFTGSW